MYVVAGLMYFSAFYVALLYSDLQIKPDFLCRQSIAMTKVEQKIVFFVSIKQVI